MRHIRVSLLAGLLLTGAAFAADSADTPDASLQLTGGAVAAGIGYTWGHGEIAYQGETHRFSVSGVSVVDVGAVNLSAHGVVYHLARLEDLNGDYVAASAGLTIAGGGDAVVLKNEHGVLIKLLATEKGLRFNLAGSGVRVKVES